MRMVIEEPEVERVFPTSSKVQSLIHAAPLENIYILQGMRATMMMTVVVAKLVTATVWLISTTLLKKTKVVFYCNLFSLTISCTS